MRTETNFDQQVVGIDTDGNIYTLSSVFDYGNGLRGATGSIFDVHKLAWVEENNTDEDFRVYLEECLGTATLREARQFKHESGLEFPGQDDSYKEKWRAIMSSVGIDPDVHTLSCCGGGRCFGRDTEWARIVNQDLLDLINSYEMEAYSKDLINKRCT